MNNLKKIRMFFSLSWKISPSYILLLIVNTIAGGGQIIANVVLPKFLIDELLGEREVGIIVFFVCAIVLTNLFFAFLNNLMKRTMEVKNRYMSEKMNYAMGEKIMNVEFSYLENPYYLDLKERAVFATTNQQAMLGLVKSIAFIFKNVFTIAGLFAIMLFLSRILVLMLLVTVVIGIVIYFAFVNYQVNFFSQIIPVNRKYGYYLDLCYDNRLQKDIRLYSMNKMLSDRVTEYNKEINDWFSGYYEKQGVVTGVNGIINDLQAAIAYGYVALRVATDWFGPRIGIGSFSMYVSSAINFARETTELSKNIVMMGQTLRFLDPFMEFMSLPDEKDVGGDVESEGEVESIEFRNVSFKYPGSDMLVLDDISFKISKGEKISIVGLNGAGKTTLVKLVCRLYRPMSGKILINGRDVFEYDYTSYMKKIAAVFQDYKLFAFSIEENITCKDVGEDTERAMAILEEVGMTEKVQSLPEGIRSRIGKAYDEKGIEMSGGQTQKIAIARALYKDASLVILDEPTSALDPIAEADIYANFNKLIGKKTAIYISHRMSSSVFCDRVLIIEKGKVQDYDTHENLLKKTDSLYYKLFQSQAVNYKID